MMALSFYIEYWKGIAPCPLCILQRFVLGCLGILFLIGAIFPFKKLGLIIMGLLGFGFSMLGAFLAGRQIWIQHLPANQTPDCGVSLQYMLHVLPIDQVAKKIFQGSSECSLISWTFWDLSLAQWSFIWFVVFSFFTFWQTFRKK